MNESELLLLWGKTCRDPEVAEKDLLYHPLLFHLLDVGNCALILWEECLPQSVKKRLARALGLDEATTQRAIVLLTALHDLGKAAPGFQLQGLAPLFLRPQLEAADLRQSGDTRNEPHSLITSFDLMRWLPTGQWIWTAPENAAKILAHAVGAHHGNFPTSGFGLEFGSGVLGDESWHAARRALAAQVIELLDEGPSFSSGDVEDAGAVAVLSGFIAVADWLGSSYFFPLAGHRDRNTSSARDYQARSQQQARDAMERFGWLPTVQFSTEKLDFSAFFEFSPNDLQKAVLKQSAELNGPFLAIAEAPMGVGKTEAAFAAIDAALWQKRANGFYIALPTQATGNALHDRVRDDYLAKGRHKGNLNLQLVHSGALLKDDLQIQHGAIWDEASERPTVGAQSWFTHRKQSLLAPFGVGTIDQSLTGVLQTKHWFVRLFGLAGKVVVFDEVHAYDTYMNTLLCRLLAWLRALDCSVILLSATLPSSRRRELLKAWGTSVREKEAFYPRLTWADSTSTRSLAVPHDSAPKTISLHFLPTETSSLAAALREKLRDGGCACVICNTVERAQNTFEELRAELGEDFGEWHLFHARFPFDWRQKREKALLKSFGKKKAARPVRAIVVATQVIEQSLDLDFDWMATELAPIDLVLQRAGRLHRHTHDEHKEPISRPAPLQTPTLAILCDEEAALPRLDVPDAIYSHFILLRSWLVLRSPAVLESEALKLPKHIEPLIEAVYEWETEDKLLAPDASWQNALDAAREVLKTRQHDARSKARGFCVSPPDDAETVCDAPTLPLRDDDDPTVHENLRAATRDGDPSIQCICLIRTDDGLFLPGERGEADLSQQPVDENQTPDQSRARALLRCGVPISNKGLFYNLLDQAVPIGWRDSAYLRFTRTLEFRNGVCTVGNKKLQLHPELGLRLLKESIQGDR